MEEASPIELPPVIPTIQETLEAYISSTDKLRIHQHFNNLRLFPTFPSERNVQPLLNFHEAPIPLVQQVKRDPTTGKIVNYEEVETKALSESAKNSFSLTRTVGPRDEFLRGNATNYPFWPGGFEKEDVSQSFSKQMRNLSVSDNETEISEADIFHELFEKELLTCAPGLDRGVDFKSTATNSINAEEGTKFEDDVEQLKFWGEGQDKNNSDTYIEQKRSEAKISQSEGKLKRLFTGLRNEQSIKGNDDIQLDNESPKPVPVLRISKIPHGAKAGDKLPWAELVDVTVPMSEEEFKQKVPIMAKKYDFQLDTFQKEAIVKLQDHENVFIAAHTSAGKTVVAEYAIALSVRHMTRTIYTSPIKALSNQKFRDFKDQFESVGLVTGDIQINSNASCLIMTTEILRSMLYNGSDVIRDLEWVVFDEIHYLNNEERGHVWEEALIMLPKHVSIIMLSATVPNALSFANWVGKIKDKKIYVISTLKRPVPLEHFLYTGTGGKSKDERFLILNKEGSFLNKGYDDAKQAKEARLSNYNKQFGAKGKDQGRKGFNEQQERNLYNGLIDHLNKNAELPVVIFTFSRNRCDQYAKMMTTSSLDLCTRQEEGFIHGFFQKSIAKLKGTDPDLPQVQQVKAMLKKGIGVHHSGILPILKEVVEMLFQQGKVKILFATETFAMGVNMPARTVVFDNCRKHDGTVFRPLNPAEYIQMAGRAGRRNTDEKGTVIILCKTGLPEIHELKNMLTGSAAQLQSQFRLTYSMILNLVRVEKLTVEELMERSFLEAGKSKNIAKIKENREKVLQKLEQLEQGPKDGHLLTLCLRIGDYLRMRKSVMESLVLTPPLPTVLGPGRCILFEGYPERCPRFGIILCAFSAREADIIRRKYSILALMDTKEVYSKLSSLTEDYSLDSLSEKQVNTMYQLYKYYAIPKCPKLVPELRHFEGSNGRDLYPCHEVVEIYAENILEICKKEPIRVDERAVVTDVSKREMTRFKQDKPVPNVMAVLKELSIMTTQEVTKLPGPVEYIKFNELILTSKDVSFLLKFEEFKSIEFTIKNWKLTTVDNFEKMFLPIFEYVRLVNAKNEYDFLLSPQSLQLHEDYQARINVLKKLGYIDDECIVQLKGRVACELGNQNELLITEMILNNILADCPPEEIAALLSCMVCEAKGIQEPTLLRESHLAQKVQEIKSTARKIAEIQRDCGLKEPIEQYVEQFKFGLVEVVYEWAKGKDFCEIMKLTEAQEGIIVRTIQRLDELMRDVKDAARTIGEPLLKKKMEEASNCIKRDIVFAASLYTMPT